MDGTERKFVRGTARSAHQHARKAGELYARRERYFTDSEKLNDITAFVAVFVAVIVAVLVPEGVPVPLAPPLPGAAPPHPAMPSSNTKPNTANAGAKRRKLRRTPSQEVARIKQPRSTMSAGGMRRIGPPNVAGGAMLPAVVFTVSVTFAEVVVPLNERDETAEPFCVNEQAAPAGRFEHERLLIVAENPLFAAKVSEVLPDCPADGTVTVEGEAESERYGMVATKFATFIEPRPVARS